MFIASASFLILLVYKILKFEMYQRSDYFWWKIMQSKQTVEIAFLSPLEINL